MKRNTIASALLAASVYLFIAAAAQAAPTSTTVQNIIITGLKNAPCTMTDSNGQLGSTNCGTGGGGTTTTINGVQGPTFTITITNTSTASSITTSSAQLFLNLLQYTSGTNINVAANGTINFVDPGYLTNISTTIATTLPLSGGGNLTNNGTLTLSCPTCISTTSGNWAGTWQNKNASDFLASSTSYISSVVSANGLITTSTAGTVETITASSSPTFTNATTTGTFAAQGTSTLATTTATKFTNSSVKSALVLNDTNGLEGAYAGSSACSAGNAVTTVSATGTTTCSPFLTSYNVIAGSGISVSTSTTSATVTNTGVLSYNGATGTVTGVSSINGATGTYAIVAGTNITISTSSTSTTINSTASGGAGSPATSTFSWLIEFPTATENDAIWIAPASTTVKACNAVNKTTADTVTFGIGVSSTRAAATSTLLQIATSTVTATTTPASLSIINSHITSTWPLIFWTTAASSSQFTLTCSVAM